MKLFWLKHQWSIVIFLVIGLAIACLFTRCSSSQVRQDIKEQIDESEKIAEESKDVVKDSKEEAGKLRKINTPETNQAAIYLDSCSSKLDQCADQLKKNELIMKQLSEQLAKKDKQIESMQFYYEVGKATILILIGMGFMLILYILGRYVFKWGFLI